MQNFENMGWDPQTIGELDHRVLSAPHLKLRSAVKGSCGDVVYSVDLRIKSPNKSFMSILEMHSMEHFLLKGFKKYLPDNFISIGLMGCQTGFYLILLNEGRQSVIMDAFEKVLRDILSADEVPYNKIDQCGNYLNHDLALVQSLAEGLLEKKSTWRQVVLEDS